MSLSSHKILSLYKSPVCIVLGFLYRSRQTQQARADRLAEENRSLKADAREFASRQKALEDELHICRQLERSAMTENAELRSRKNRLPPELNLRGHKFGPEYMALCVNLSRLAGFRGAANVLSLMFSYLGIEAEVPSFTAIRNWGCRLGVGMIEASRIRADDWILMLDHSVQIGPEKVLFVLGIRARDVPLGRALQKEDMRPLGVIARSQWKATDVSKSLKELVEIIGTPIAVLADGAAELRDGVKTLNTPYKTVHVIHDLKHIAANLFKNIVGKEKSNKKFTSKIGVARSVTQQTELALFTPPQLKPKARFMNMEATLNWAEMVLWNLSHWRSEAREEITAERMNAKLGWLRNHRNDIKRWSECQTLISTALTWSNKNGLFLGAADELQSILKDLTVNCQARQIGEALIDYIRETEKSIKTLFANTPKIPVSTEILESSFGSYKQLEKQHCKGGFTSLIAAMGGLLNPATAKDIKRAFELVDNKKLKTWVKQNLGKTVTAKKHAAYKEVSNAAAA